MPLSGRLLSLVQRAIAKSQSATIHTQTREQKEVHLHVRLDDLERARRPFEAANSGLMGLDNVGRQA